MTRFSTGAGSWGAAGCGSAKNTSAPWPRRDGRLLAIRMKLLRQLPVGVGRLGVAGVLKDGRATGGGIGKFHRASNKGVQHLLTARLGNLVKDLAGMRGP